MIIDDTQRALLPTTLAMVDGCFDPLHRGHVEYFRRAKELGTPVLCNLASDSYVRDNKGRPPLLAEVDRAAVIDAIRYVDFVFVTRQGTAWSLQHFCPRYHVKGRDWIGKLPAEQVAICRELEIEIVYVDCAWDSSTRILRTFLEKQRVHSTV
jgi:D-beta-D-heptose 7-phosphate kinase/D-beta-D-heptose 1-phosphate adenosyltransferase